MERSIHLTRHGVVAAGLLLLFAAAGANSIVRDSATFDETAHLPAGYSYLDHLDFRLNPEHPPLPKAWAALPLWLVGAGEPDYASAAWRGRRTEIPSQRSKADQWTFGYEFLNGPVGSPERRDPQRLLVPARLAMLVPGLFLALVVYFWSRELWGRRGALIALFLYCLSPTMLAHARLVTTDLPNALGYTATLWTLWRFCRAPGAWRASAFGGCFALALLMKFSALALAPILVALALLWTLWPGPQRGLRRQRARRAGAVALLAIVIGWSAVWLGYGLRFDASSEQGYVLDWEVVGLKEGLGADAVHFALEHRLLPEAYLYGLAYSLGGAARRLSFLNGETSIIGWWYYFPEALFLKTAPALLLLLAWLGGLAVWHRRWRAFDGWFLVLPVAIYLALSVSGNLNIGHRHLAPLYPLLFVVTGGLTRFDLSARVQRVALAVLLAGYASSFAFATPRYLSYFNLLAGGARNGWHYLLDSNIDWGQDLVRLGQWTEQHDVDEIYLIYFGTADPAAHGVPYKKVLMVHDFEPGRPAESPPRGSLLAVSVNLLQGLYFDVDAEIAERVRRRGWVSDGQLRDWLRLRDRASRSGSRHPDLATWLMERGILDSRQRAEAEASLLSHRLARLRDHEAPVALVGDSIRIYRVP